MGEIVLVISGASGSIYGVRLAEILGKEVRLVVTESGRITMAHECDGLTPEQLAEKTGAILEKNKDIAAKSASGSAEIDAVVICPCSGTTLGKLAAGIGDNLATRSAIVAMKERRKLIMVPLLMLLRDAESVENASIRGIGRTRTALKYGADPINIVEMVIAVIVETVGVAKLL